MFLYFHLIRQIPVKVKKLHSGVIKYDVHTQPEGKGNIIKHTQAGFALIVYRINTRLSRAPYTMMISEISERIFCPLQACHDFRDANLCTFACKGADLN